MTRPPPGPPPRTTPTARGAVAAALALAVLASGPGCGAVQTKQPRLRNATRLRVERLAASRGAGDAVAAALVRHGLPGSAAGDPASAARALADRLEQGPGAPASGDVLALAELCDRAGSGRLGVEPGDAARFDRDAAVLAALALADPALPAPGAAIAVHNRALARLVRGSQKQPGRPWPQALADAGLTFAAAAPHLVPERFDALTVADDVRVTGMDHVYRTCGLGVPLVALRKIDHGSPDPQDRHYPRQFRAAATAVVVPRGGVAGGAWRHAPAAFTLFDPFDVRAVSTGGTEVPMATDRTTPLAVQVSDRAFPVLELTGLFESSFRDGAETGLYMLRPYKPGKIPVVLVHGLVSSPRAFVQTINELANDPALDGRYQFWVFLYPTGEPIPRSASELRAALTRARDSFDPGHADPALDRTVLVGHSMGGILAKMTVQDTGRTLWDATIHAPPEGLKASADVRDRLTGMLILKPLPFVSRVVFIATPHRGSRLANAMLGRVVSGLVRRPDGQAAAIAELEELNGPDVISRELRGRTLNSVGNLRTDSPVLTALDRVPIRPTVPYHSIIPQVGGNSGTTDAVVPYRSSHLPGADSELILPGTHFAQQKPQVTAELKRILREHLDGP